jgi:chemotaxis protein MotA
MADQWTTGTRAATTTPSAAPTGASLDMATLLGLVGAFVLLSAAVVLSGSAASFFNFPSILIVLGGTFAVTAVSFSADEVWRAQTLLFRALVYRPLDPSGAAERVMSLAEVARQRGPMLLESQLASMAADPFLQRALRLVVDGALPEEIETTMTSELQATQMRHSRSVGVLRRAADVAPSMGLIGTLVGLIQMLGNLDDPKAIGPGMAVALLTTFYGAIVSHVVLLPMAGKLERNSNTEALVNQIYLLGALSMSRQENPRRLENLINTVLSPAQRIRYFD